jgi:hypothetical protein
LSKIALSGNASGTGTFTLASPNSNSDFTLSLPATTAPILAGSGITLSASAPANTLVTDASGNVGIGTNAPNVSGLEISRATGSSSPIPTELRLTSAQGGSDWSTTLPWARLSYYSTDASTSGPKIVAAIDTVAATGANGASSLNFSLAEPSAGVLTERMRIDSSGNLLVGTTSSSLESGAGFKFNSNDTMGMVVNSATGGSSHIHLYNINATFNGYRFYVATNGGIYNFSGNNSNLSDERTKTNVELAGDYLGKVCAIPVKLFNYKDESEGEQRTLGVIAQDVEAVAPELVNNEGFGESPEGEAPLKSIYTTDMMYALMKAIQELNAKVDAQAAEIAALKGQA